MCSRARSIQTDLAGSEEKLKEIGSVSDQFLNICKGQYSRGNVAAETQLGDHFVVPLLYGYVTDGLGGCLDEVTDILIARTSAGALEHSSPVSCELPTTRRRSKESNY